MTFVKHAPCPKCGSRDNLGIWADGSQWCFGCRHHVPANPHSFNPKHKMTTDTTKKFTGPPNDISTIIGTAGLAWLEKYGIGTELALKYNIQWSESRQQLVFCLGSVWQARNFIEGKQKYFTQGNINELLFIYSNHNVDLPVDNQPLVLVEDCISAMKVSEVCDAAPLLGCHLATSRMLNFLKLYNRIIVWLDANKFKEACKISDKIRALGVQATVIYTQKDPKEYTTTEIGREIGFRQYAGKAND